MPIEYLGRSNTAYVWMAQKKRALILTNTLNLQTPEPTLVLSGIKSLVRHHAPK
jgi:hypothetical protein